MHTRPIARLVAFGLSAVMTLAMLAGVDVLAAVEPAPSALLAVAAPLLA